MQEAVEVEEKKKYPCGFHPNSLKNLKPYKKGENGHGRVYPMKERLRHALDHPLTKPKADAPVGDHIVYTTLEGALQREPTPFREVWDRVEGPLNSGTGTTINIISEEVTIDARQILISRLSGIAARLRAPEPNPESNR